MKEWKNLVMLWIEELQKEKLEFLKNYSADIEFTKYKVLDLRQKFLYDALDQIKDKDK